MNATTIKPGEADSTPRTNALLGKEREPAQSVEQQFVLLTIGNETYGIEIGLIHGIIMPQAVTEVPKTPPYVIGVTNLRGNILPVIDMRTRFDLGPATAEEAKQVRFVVVETHGLTAALVVDAVSEVARLSAKDIEPPSQLLHSDAYEYMSGVGKLPAAPQAAPTIAQEGRETIGRESERLVMILDVPKLLDRGLCGRAAA